MDIYFGNPTVRTLVELSKAIPIWGTAIAAVDAGAVAAIQRYRANQFSVFIDALDRCGVSLDDPLPEGEKFEVIRAIVITIEAVARENRKEKIEALARLLAAGLAEPPRISFADEFEDYLRILDDVSMREIEMMTLLAEFEFPFLANGTDSRRTELDTYWEGFTHALTVRLGIPHAEVYGLLARLGRTGLFEMLSRPVAGFNRSQGILSGVFYRLANTIRDYPGQLERR